MHIIHDNIPVDSSVRVMIVDRQCEQVHWAGFLPKFGATIICVPNAGGIDGFIGGYFIGSTGSCCGTAYICAR